MSYHVCGRVDKLTPDDRFSPIRTRVAWFISPRSLVNSETFRKLIATVTNQLAAFVGEAVSCSVSNLEVRE